MSWLILPHPQAPLFSEVNAGLVVDQVLSEVEGKSYPTTEAFRQFMRQLGFVNLWFFLKFIAGHNGPFDKLDNNLHLDMCNTRMRYQRPGARFAAFEPRKIYKTSCFTTGAMAWSALRDPWKSHTVFSSTSEFAIGLLHIIQRIFDSNELFAWLYPEYVPGKNQKEWNDVRAVLPNRPRITSDPTFSAFGVGCSTAGKHPDDIYIDDPVGDQQLNAMRQSSAEMYKIANWVKSNIRTLTKNTEASIYYCGTRYAVDDAHSFIFNSVKEKLGYWDELDPMTYTCSEKGEWSVYYRMVEENGVIIMPEAYTREGLELMKVEDPWTYWTQAQNHPQKSGLAELNNYEVPSCELLYDDVRKNYIIRIPLNGELFEEIPLSVCDLVQAGDPAGADKYLSAKTSRSAVVVVAHDPKDRRFILRVSVDYCKTSDFFNWFFNNALRYERYLRATLLEAQGSFKILGPLLREEEARRNMKAIAMREKQIFLKMKPVTKTGEKDVVIRNVYEPLLNARKLYVEREAKEAFMGELNIFPQSNKKDILDAGALALQHTIKPMGVEEIEFKQEQEERFRNRMVGVCGW